MKDKKHGGTSLDAELDDYWKNKEDEDPTDKGKSLDLWSRRSCIHILWL